MPNPYRDHGGRGEPVKIALAEMLDNLERSGFELQNVYAVDAESAPSREALEVVATLRIRLVFEKPDPTPTPPQGEQLGEEQHEL